MTLDIYAQDWEHTKKMRRECDQDEESFGRCYHCRDYDDHKNCIGVPCECSCPLPSERETIELKNSALSKLTEQERKALGF